MTTAPTSIDHDVPQDFHDEYESESLSKFRTRYLVLAAVVAAILFALSILQIIFSDRLQGLSEARRNLGVWAGFAGSAGVLVRFVLVYLKRQSITRADLLLRVKRLIIAFTLLQIPTAFALASLINQAIAGPDSDFHLGFGVPPLLGALTVHFIAALLIPWTVKEALRPILPFVLVFTFISILAIVTGDSSIDAAIGQLLVTAFIVVPGLAISWWRHSRFREEFLNRAVRARYAELSAELSTARRIHDRLFPLPIREGPIRVEFAYEPMRQIGGDILYARRAPAPDGHAAPVDLVVIDVTGHGIAAALAVNRLHAELNRIYGLNPQATPAEVISALNSYVYLTMASDRFFATALCLRADAAAGLVSFANAGHPPAFLFPRGGTTPRLLESTAVMLGVVDESEFDPGAGVLPLGEGDTLYCYSDGAIESRTAGGQMLGIGGFQRCVAGREAPEQAVRAVQAFRKSPPQDDTLVVRLDRV